MRKKAIIFLAIFGLIIAVIAYFFRDRYIERAIEKTWSVLVGAKVEIDDFHFSLAGLSCSWERLQVANPRDPWKNILETGHAAFALEPRPLFWKRIIIREMTLKNVRSGTHRESDGSLPRKISPDSEGRQEPGFFEKVGHSLKNQLQSLPVLDLSSLGKKFNVASLVDPKRLSSVQGYASLKSVADSSFSYWQAQISDPKILQQISELEQETRKLKLQKPKDVAGLALQIKTLQGIQKKAQTLKSEITSTRKGLTNTLSELQIRLAKVQQSVQGDIRRTQKLARLGNLQVRDVGLLLLGEPLVQRIGQVLGYVEIGRKILPTAQKLMINPKAEKPPRFKGQDIRFPFHYRYPKFLLREAKMTVSAASRDTSQARWFKGAVTGITNEPVVYGRPTAFDFFVGRLTGNQYSVSGAFDHTQAEARDTLKIRASQFGLGKIQLASSSYFPKALIAQKGDVSLTGIFIGPAIDLKLKFLASPVTFQFGSDAQNEIARIVRQVLKGVNQLDLKCQVVGEKDNYLLRMQTNLDQVLARRIKGIFDRKLQDARQQIERYVRAEADKQKREVENFIALKKQMLLAEADQIQRRVDKRLAELEKNKKGLAARMKTQEEKARKVVEEKKKQLEKEAKKSLKSLLKKKKN